MWILERYSAKLRRPYPLNGNKKTIINAVLVDILVYAGRDTYNCKDKHFFISIEDQSICVSPLINASYIILPFSLLVDIDGKPEKIELGHRIREVLKNAGGFHAFQFMEEIDVFSSR